MDKRAKDLRGQRFGFLTAMEYLGPHKRGALWRLRCDCGATTDRPTGDFTRMRNKAPGCPDCRQKGRPKDHGLSRHPIYAVHRSMLDRCSNPRHAAWRNYGGRGITVCEAWRDFSVFAADMLPTYRPGLSLERRDNDRGYSPDNCYWAMPLEQHNNTRANTYVQTPKGRFTLAQASRAYGVPYNRLLTRLAAGWSLDRALGVMSTTSSTAAPEADSSSPEKTVNL